MDASVAGQRHEWGEQGAEHPFWETVISERVGAGVVASDPRGTELTRSVWTWEGDVVERRTGEII